MMGNINFSYRLCFASNTNFLLMASILSRAKYMRINKMKLFCSGTQTFIGPQNAPGKTEGKCYNFLHLSDQQKQNTSNLVKYEAIQK